MPGRAATLWTILPRGVRRGLIILASLSLVSAGAELATFAALASFLSQLARPGIDLTRSAALFALAAVCAAVVRTWLATRTLQVSMRVAHETGVECQRRLLHQPLSFHAGFNSARALALIEKVQLLSGSVLQPLLALGQSITIGGALLVAIALASPLPALMVGLAIGVAYALAAWATWRRIDVLQPTLSKGFDQRTQVVQESFAGVRDVILDQSQAERTRAFAQADGRIQTSLVSIQALAAAPRYLVEGFGLALIGLLVMTMARRGLADTIPAVGLLAYAAMRLLPLVNSAFASWQSWRAHRAVIDDVAFALDLPLVPRMTVAPRQVHQSVALDQVSFAYPGGDSVISDLSLTLPKGSKTGIFGATGSGKSTLADLLMGLIDPLSGSLQLDGDPLVGDKIAAWQASIVHVGQHLFLLDATIADNISVGDPSPERARVLDALERACLIELASRLDDRVGERGIRLSGGQRQRLALARAFYRDRPFVVLDEATNALDPATEARILANFGEGKTMLIIGHRPSALATCDRLFEMVDGKLVERSTGSNG